MSLMPSDWEDIAALCAVLGVIWGITAFVLHAFLARYFASRASVRAVEAQIAEMQVQLRTLPTHADITQLTARLTTLGTAMAGMEGTLVAVKHTTDLLLRHQIDKGE
jgi:hypothetical protein